MKYMWNTKIWQDKLAEEKQTGERENLIPGHKVRKGSSDSESKGNKAWDEKLSADFGSLSVSLEISPKMTIFPSHPSIHGWLLTL